MFAMSYLSFEKLCIGEEQTITCVLQCNGKYSVIPSRSILHKYALEGNLIAYKRALKFMRQNALSHALDAQNELGQTPLFIWAGRGCKEGIMATIVTDPDPNICGTFAWVSANGDVFQTRWMTPVGVITMGRRRDLLVSFLQQARENAEKDPRLRLKIDQMDSVRCE